MNTDKIKLILSLRNKKFYNDIKLRKKTNALFSMQGFQRINLRRKFSHMQIISRPIRCMIVFNNVESKIRDMKEKNKTVSTLLIPESLLKSFLQKRATKHKGNTTVYFRNLLALFRVLTYSGMIPSPSKIKTEYQVENLNLKRISFRPDNSSWIELGELALAFGKSRCWIFTFLLELDLSGFSEIFLKFFKPKSVPTTPNLKLKSSWTLQPHFDDFARSFHVKV